MMVIPILRKSNWKNPADMTTITVFLNIPYGLKSIPHDFSQNCSVTMWVVCSLSNSLVVEKISHKDWTWDLSISPPETDTELWRPQWWARDIEVHAETCIQDTAGICKFLKSVLTLPMPAHQWDIYSLVLENLITNSKSLSSCLEQWVTS